MNTSTGYLVLSETMGFFWVRSDLSLQTIETSICVNLLLLQTIGLSTYRRFLLLQTIWAFIYRNRLSLQTIEPFTYRYLLLLQTIRAFIYRNRLLSEKMGVWRTKKRLCPKDLSQAKREEMMPSETKKASSVRRMVSAGSCRRTRRPEAM